IVRAYDPGAGDRPRDMVPGIELCGDAYDAATGADAYDTTSGTDALVLLTEWDEFRWLDFDRVRDAMRGHAIVDARNLLDPAAMRRRGFAYQGVGRR
ncbi:MAG TPA: UDP binding domain-containing protein, partial [Acidimicrobiia bacterium]